MALEKINRNNNILEEIAFHYNTRNHSSDVFRCYGTSIENDSFCLSGKIVES